MNDLTTRVTRTIESILENERLTADLDDEAAKILLDWGIINAKTIVQSTAGFADEAAEEAMYPRLKANRRVMRLANKWVNQLANGDTDKAAKSLNKIMGQAVILYDQELALSTPHDLNTFLNQQTTPSNTPSQLITHLCQFLEKTFS